MPPRNDLPKWKTTLATMKILALADTHGRHRSFSRLPEADVFLHAGDFTKYGSGAEEFALWFHRLPYQLKLLTLGNHELKDSVAKYNLDHWHSLFGPMLLLDRGARAKVGERDLVVFGVPHATETAEIPAGIDIVLSHEPPYRVLDRTHGGANAGSERIAALVERSQPTAHVFGHVHAQGGGSSSIGPTMYINVATRAVLFEVQNGYVKILESLI